MRVSLFLILLAQFSKLNSQNLVPNSGFELYNGTADAFQEEAETFDSNVEYWFSPTTGTPDIVGPAFKVEAFETPAPHQGIATLGLVNLSSTTEYQGFGDVILKETTYYAEYAGVRLLEKLQKGTTYYVEFWIRRTNHVAASMNKDRVLNPKFGIHFARERIFYKDDQEPMELTPQVISEDSLVITATQWSKVSAFFKAEQDYSYLYLGQFGKVNSELEFMRGYYLIDDVLVKNISVNDLISNSTTPIAGLTIPFSNLNFQSGNTTLTSRTSLQELKSLVTYLNENKNLRIRIAGHTDSIGNPQANLDLSHSRARVIYDLLIKEGLDETRMEWKGYGETNPVSSNDTKEGRDRNRRVEFVVLED